MDLLFCSLALRHKALLLYLFGCRRDRTVLMHRQRSAVMTLVPQLKPLIRAESVVTRLFILLTACDLLVIATAICDLAQRACPIQHLVFLMLLLKAY